MGIFIGGVGATVGVGGALVGVGAAVGAGAAVGVGTGIEVGLGVGRAANVAWIRASTVASIYTVGTAAGVSVSG